MRVALAAAGLVFLAACGADVVTNKGGTPSLVSPLASRGPSAETPARTLAAEPTSPLDDPACATLALPELHAAVIVIPRPVWVAAMRAVLRAACSCTRPGDETRFVATLSPELGAADLVAPGSEATAACLEASDIRFPAFPVGSDCIRCGPRRFGVFHGSPPRALPPASSRIAYPFVLLHP